MERYRLRKKIVLWLVVILAFSFAGCSKQAQETEIKTLTLAVVQSENTVQSSNLAKWVNHYNETHADVQIEIVNYLASHTELEDAFNQIKIEINAGKGPDMIDFGRQYSPLDASCGMMADLYPFLQKDASFKKQDYFYNIMEAFEVGESLYVIVPGYAIDTYATTNKELAGLERMNMKQLIDAYHTLGKESILIPGEMKSAVFAMFCYGCLDQYIDWEEGTCDFQSESFQELLGFANSFPLYLNIAEDYSAKQIFEEGRALLYPVSVDSAYKLTSARMLYGETPTYIGYPFESGYGSMAAIEDIAIGISATSQNKEEAWEFISSLLGRKFQDNVEGLPLRIASLEQRLEEAMMPEYDAKGEKVAKEYLRFDGEDPVGIYEITEEDAETLKAIIGKVEFPQTTDYNLYNIILEEAAYLFNEDRDVEEVADIIQKRANIYVSEMK